MLFLQALDDIICEVEKVFVGRRYEQRSVYPLLKTGQDVVPNFIGVFPSRQDRGQNEIQNVGAFTMDPPPREQA